MADLIDRGALLEDLKARHDYVMADEGVSKRFKWYEAICNHAIVNAVQTAPAVDAVEVCRCKDCKHFAPCDEVDGVSWTGFCNYGVFHTDEDDFCSRGERRRE